MAASNPYVGPGPYRRGDTRVFVGRDDETNELLARLISEGVVLFHALSGAGKSSLVNAGLIPKLEEEGYTVLPVTRVGTRLPGDVHREDGNPFIANMLWHLTTAKEGPAWTEGESWIATGSLKDYLRLTRAPAGTAQKPHVLVIDQFEEILTTHLDCAALREGLFAQIRDALCEDPLLSVLLVAREEFAARLQRFREWLPGDRLVAFHMEQLRTEEAAKAVREPAARRQCAIGDDAVDLIVSDLSGINVDGEGTIVPGEYVEPVTLQVVCFQLWSELTDDGIQPPPARVDAKTIRSALGITRRDSLSNRALTVFYETTIREVAAERSVSEAVIRGWFSEKLLTASGVRTQVLREAVKTGGLRNDVVDALARRHLLRAEQARNATWYELVHDRLIAPIQHSNAQALPKVVRQILRDVRIWEVNHEVPRYLYNGSRLGRAEELRRKHPELLNVDDVNKFLLASAAVETRNTRILRWSLLTAVVAAAVAVFFAVAFGDRARVARSRALAASSLGTVSSDPDRALLLALEAADTDWVDAGRTGDGRSDSVSQALNTALQNVRTERLYRNPLVPAVAAAGAASASAAAAAPREDPALGVAFVRDQDILVTFSESGLIRQLNWVTGEPVADDLHATPRTNSGTRGTPFAATSDRLMWASDSGTVGIWDAAKARASAEWQPVVRGVQSIAVDPSGRYLAIAGGGLEVRNLESHASVSLPVPADVSVCAVAFGPDGQLAYSTGDTVILAGLDPSKSRHELKRPFPARGAARLAMCALTFDATGQHLLAGDSEGVVTVWNTNAGPEPPRNVIADSRGALQAIAASPDGIHFATGGADGTIRFWKLGAAVPVLELAGHRGPVRSLAFTGLGDRLASGSMDGAVRIWNVARLPQLRRVEGVSLTPDGTLLAVPERVVNDTPAAPCPVANTRDYNEPFSEDTCIAVWSLTDARRLGRFPCRNCGGAALTLDQRRLVTYGGNGLQIWIIDNATFLRGLPRAGGGEDVGRVNAIALSEDGQFVAALTEKDVVVWDAETTERRFSWRDTSDFGEQRGQGNPAPPWRALSLSPDGRWLALGGERVLLVDLRSGKDVAQTYGYPDRGVPLERGSPLERDSTALNIVDFAWGLDVSSGASAKGTFRLAGISATGDIIQWRAPRADVKTTGPERLPLAIQTHLTDVTELAYTPDGRLLAVASNRGLQAWNTNDGAQSATFDLISGAVHTVAFASASAAASAAPRASSYAMTIVSSDGTLRRWTTDRETLRWKAFTRAVRGLTPDECRMYLGVTSCSSTASGVEHLARAIALGRAAGTPEAWQAATREFIDAEALMGWMGEAPSASVRRARAEALEDVGARALARQRVADTGLDTGRRPQGEDSQKLAARRVEEAIAQFRAAQEVRRSPLDTNKDLPPLDILMVRQLLFSVEQLAAGQHVTTAITAYRAAEEFNKAALSRSKADAAVLNNLCWFGTLAGKAGQVVQFCELALKLDDNGNFRDSQGLARLCAGDAAGAGGKDPDYKTKAIADFQAYVNWTRDSQDAAERKEWIARIPKERVCTEEFLDKLRQR
jgi:WD40 repeat protein